MDRPPSFVGWRTSDQEEITRRLWRGRTEVLAVEALELADRFFGAYRVRSASGASYEVEIRSLATRENSCGCVDHAVNGLGTCKHIEGALHALRRGRSRQFDQAARQGCPWAEVYVSRQGESEVRLQWPADPALAARLREHLGDWFTDEGVPRGPSDESVSRARRAVTALPEALRRRVRLSRHLEAWAEGRRRREAREAERDRFLAEAETGAASLDMLRHPLLPYQRDGMLHLAFSERALLADDMGLGKTVQAIAACALLRRQRGVERVLVVAPASLKAEWQEQIARFTTLPVQIVEGDRATRLRRLPEPSVLQSRQLRAGHPRRPRHQPPAPARRRDSGRGAAHQELANQDRESGQGTQKPLRLRADRHAAPEPHRRDLLDRPVSRPWAVWATVPLQS